MKNKALLVPVFTGLFVAMVVSLVLCGILAGVLLGGAFSADLMPVLGWATTAAACFLGCYVSARQAAAMPLPVAVLSAAVYLAAVFILRGIFFQSVGEKAFVTALFALLAAFSGAVTAAGRQKNRRRR